AWNTGLRSTVAGLILLLMPSVCLAVPDGTVLMMYADNVVGKVAHRITHDKYTHTAIVLDGVVYEATVPSVRKSPFPGHHGRTTHVFAYVPKQPFTAEEVANMMQYAESRLGQPYGLKNYFWKNSRPDGRTWCSEFVRDVLNSSHRYHLSYGEGFEPQTLLNTIGGEFSGPIVVSEPSYTNPSTSGRTNSRWPYGAR
ncbi:MAG: YiiX/YebB-like N1pC/P60 family cysteine hydrolase, partial [Rhodopirellula sp. JB044]|uniref:YiiX/YebB-like N1pC/P60 family cysteine hydrolase n=1 Tax=Rhodopirellula sp. JB044 TaxID=3342844 RepID=UPI00370C05B6